jgi:glycosyltransferase involved in cell wall biosynthesis
MEKVTATIITKNEEANIERCLKSLDWVDEIVILDSGSTDRTLEICSRYDTKIIKTEWLGFGKTKKAVVNEASNNWIFSIDADEEVSSELKNKVKSILSQPSHAGYKIKRHSYFLGKRIKYCGWSSDYPLRLFDRTKGNFNEKEVHESVEVQGSVITIIEPLNHYTYPTIGIQITKLNRYSDLQAGELIAAGKRYSVFTALFFAIIKFKTMYFLRLGFLDGKAGFLLCWNTAFSVYLKYVKTIPCDTNHQ